MSHPTRIADVVTLFDWWVVLSMNDVVVSRRALSRRRAISTLFTISNAVVVIDARPHVYSCREAARQTDRLRRLLFILC